MEVESGGRRGSEGGGRSDSSCAAMVRDLVGSGGAQSGEDELQYSEADAVSSPFSVRRPGAAHHLTVEERWSNSCSGCGEVGAEGRPEATGEVSAGRRKLRKRRYL